MATGTVKWFNNTKGYGFLETEGVNEDIFVHFSSIQDDGFKKLKRGQQVDFSYEKGPNGLQATNVVPDEQSDDETVELSELTQPAE